MKNEIEQSKGKDIDLSRQKNEPEQAVTVEGESTAKETAASVLDPIERLAYDIDQFVFDFDPYEYRDQVDRSNWEAEIKRMAASLRRGYKSGVRDWLQSVLDENEPGEDTEKAAELLQRLDQLVPEQRKTTDWIMTDDDSYQICRKLLDMSDALEDAVYELYQVQEVPVENDSIVPEYVIAHDIVCCNDIDVSSVLECYGYESIEDVYDQYGDSWQQIMAECAFELDAGCLYNTSGISMPWDEATKVIRQKSGYECQREEPDKKWSLIQKMVRKIINYCQTYGIGLTDYWNGRPAEKGDPLLEATALISSNLARGNMGDFLSVLKENSENPEISPSLRDDSMRLLKMLSSKEEYLRGDKKGENYDI